MLFSLAETAKRLKIDSKIIKDWRYHFAEYLSSSANPPKGTTRLYTLEDIRVFAYVMLYWEENPDFENIKCGLNAGAHYEIELIDFLITQITPIFQEPTDNEIDITNGLIFGGMAPLGDVLSLANAFKEAGDMLIASTRGKPERYEYISPILYQYRHAIELYLKYVIGECNKIHDLSKLYEEFKQKVSVEFGVEIPSWFESIIIAFNEVDKSGTTFRYGTQIDGDEIFIDLQHIETMIGWFAEAINNINRQRAQNNP